MTYDDAVASIERSIALDRDNAELNATCIPRLLTHGRATERVILLWHGFTNCPQQFVALGEQFFARGYNVLIPRIPRHGYADRMTDVLAGLTVAELKAASLHGYRLAAGLGATVDTLGLSLGGVMAAFLAQTAPIGTALAVAPFLGLPHVPHWLSDGIVALASRLPNAWMWWDPRLKTKVGPDYAYPRFSTRALATTLQFGSSVFALASAGAPQAQRVIITINPRDPAVSNAVSEELARQWLNDGALVELHRLMQAPPRHDIIELATYPAAATVIYPTLLDLLAGARPVT